MSLKFKLLILVLTMLLGGGLRFYHLSSSPAGLYVDEAAIGYNAYSILKTGKDEYGKTFPIFFRSFGDYKMPLYIYLSVIPIKIFGLNPFAVRFVSAFCGLISIFLVYLLTKLLFEEKKQAFFLLSSFVFAFLPWTIFMSRASFEANLALTIFILALYLQIFALKHQKTIFIYVSVLMYALAAYSYHSERLLSALIFFLTFLFFARQNKKEYLIPSIILICLFLPQLLLSFGNAGQARIQTLAHFKSLRDTASLYLTYFSPRSLFCDPDPDPQRSLPDLSVFYSWMVVPYLIGLYSLISKIKQKENKMVLMLMLASPLPAALTGDPFATVRAYLLVLPLTLVITKGLWQIFTLIKNNLLKFTVALLLLSFSLISLCKNVFIYLPNQRFEAWNYGFEDLTKEIKKTAPAKVLINDTIGTFYIEMLFFQAYPPDKFHKEATNILSNYYNAGKWEGKSSWDIYEVRGIYWKKDVYQEQLIIASPIAISEDQAKEHFLTKTFAIIAPGNKVLFNGYLTNPRLKKIDDENKIKQKLNEARNF